MDLLEGPVRPYAWGSSTAIPQLLGTPATGGPMAELWLGAHPLAPSSVNRPDGLVGLDRIIAANPQGCLGAEVVERFGPRLPFLLKVLAVARPLSLQVHPSADQAQSGFTAEEAGGLPIDDPRRNYKDTGHKPELAVALEPFEVLIGFRPVASSLDVIDTLGAEVLQPYAAMLRRQPDNDGLRAIVTRLLQTPAAERAGLVADIDAACASVLAASGTPYGPDFNTIRELAATYPADPGVAVALLMQRRTLQPGEAVFVPAGLMHAYLSGVAIEVMASSDNVLRGGLTPKHVDVPGLLHVLDVGAAPTLLQWSGGPPGLRTLAPPVEEFVLHLVRPDGESVPVPGGGPRLLLCLAGEVTAVLDTGRARLARGQAAFVAASDGQLTIAGTGTVVSAGTGTLLSET